MNAITIEFLAGLLIIGASIPGLFTPTFKGSVAQLLFGILLVVLALLQGLVVYN